MLIDIRRLYDQNCCGSDFFPKGRDAFCSHRDLWDKSEGEPALVLADTHYACSETVTVEFERMRSIRIETRIFCFHFLCFHTERRVFGHRWPKTRGLWEQHCCHSMNFNHDMVFAQVKQQQDQSKTIGKDFSKLYIENSLSVLYYYTIHYNWYGFLVYCLFSRPCILLV